jgi:cell division protease FtsH
MISKEQKLADLSVYLKSRFVGLDRVIDELISKIKIWWCYPEYLFRPTIISLYGLTGTGKTELVHQIVKFLNLENEFCNLDLGNSTQNNSITYILSRAGIDYTTQGILLVDEIQKYNAGSVEYYSQQGTTNPFSGFWSLLSNGRILGVIDIISKIEATMNILQSQTYRQEQSILEIRKNIEEQNARALSANPNAQTIPFSPNQFQKPTKGMSIPPSMIYEYVDDAEDITMVWNLKQWYQGWDETQKDAQYINQLIGEKSQVENLCSTLNDDIALYYLRWKYQKFMRIKDTLSDDDFTYKKLLIIINGNLDKLFIPNTPILEQKSEDICAHIKKITVSDIRNELFRIFKPEQVSRFGSNFIIMPGLTDENYEKVIALELQKFNAVSVEKYNLNVLQYVTPGMLFDKIKERGFFPAQGVRPIVSAVGAIMGEILPEILVKHSQSK